MGWQGGWQDGITLLCFPAVKTWRNWVRLILGSASFEIIILKPDGSQIHIASEVLWANFCTFLLCIMSDLGSVLWAWLSAFFTRLCNSSGFTNLLPICVHIRKDTRTSRRWIIYLFIHYKYSFDLVKCGELEKLFFLSLLLPLILHRSHRGFKGHLKGSLLLFDSLFNISLQFCFTKSSLLTALWLLLFSWDCRETWDTNCNELIWQYCANFLKALVKNILSFTQRVFERENKLQMQQKVCFCIPILKSRWCN